MGHSRRRGGNFGIITDYTFKVRPAPDQIGIFQIIWPWRQLDEVIDSWQRWTPSVDLRLGTIVEAFSKTNGLLRSQGIFLGSKTDLKKLIEPLKDVGTPIKLMEIMEYMVLIILNP